MIFTLIVKYYTMVILCIFLCSLLSFDKFAIDSNFRCSNHTSSIEFLLNWFTLASFGDFLFVFHNFAGSE